MERPNSDPLEVDPTAEADSVASLFKMYVKLLKEV